MMFYYQPPTEPSYLVWACCPHQVWKISSNRPAVLGKIDGVPVRVVDPRFGLAVRRTPGHLVRGPQLLADRRDRRDVLNLEAEVVDPRLEVRPLDLALGSNRDERQVD